MKKSRYTEEQIAYALKQAELGTPEAEVCRKMGISDATFYNWRTKYGGLSPSELRRMKQLEEENAKLKRLVADLSLDKAMLQDLPRAKGDEAAPHRAAAQNWSGEVGAAQFIIDIASVQSSMLLCGIWPVANDCDGAWRVGDHLPRDGTQQPTIKGSMSSMSYYYVVDIMSLGIQHQLLRRMPDNHLKLDSDSG